MGKLLGLSLAAVVAAAAYALVQLTAVPELPALEPSPWWGAGQPRELDQRVREFVIDIPKEDVEELRRRLQQNPRLTPPLEDAAFTYGTNTLALQRLLEHWRGTYNWTERQRRLRSVKHYKTNIAGLDIHWMRASPPAGSGKLVRPLLMVHGWPGSFVEFVDILPLLTAPRDDSDVVFDVICPSIPGYGFSEAAHRPGLDMIEAGRIFMKLMDRLGFEKFYVQGGDWGSAIVTNMAILYPDRLYGVHVNMPTLGQLGHLKLIIGAFLPSGWVMDQQFEKYWYPLSNFYGDLIHEMGYLHIQATKPDTVGVALNDSPLGLASYILEKFSTWTDRANRNRSDGGLLQPDFPIALDKMLDNICIYWFTGSITSSMRFYKENLASTAVAVETMAKIPTAVPAGILSLQHEIMVVPRNFAAEKFTNIITFTTEGSAGHFAAMENPPLLADDLHAFASAVEALEAK